jgi:extracellular elastinolytic metalloproteinase
MTGGGTGRCLSTKESAALGEGWSDAFAEFLEHTDSSVPDFVSSVWVMNDKKGDRTYPYSTDKSVNPLRYSNLSSLFEVHGIGEVWANMLHNVYAELVTAKGFNPDFATKPEATEGNVVYFHLIMDGLLLQPCNPTFVSARDAIIQADATRYGGAHKCLLWKAFASRGLGTKAGNHEDDPTVPDDCSSTAH